MFKNILSNCDWELLYSEYHPDVGYSGFSEFFCRGIRYSFSRNPEKSWKKINPFKPIGSQDIQKFEKKKQTAQKILQKKDLRFWKDFFKKVKNSSKKLHYKNQSSKYENNLKGIWNVVKEIIRKNKLISPISGKLIVDNKEITDTIFPLISALGVY